MPSRELLALERSVSSAHRSVWRAMVSAELLGASGLAEDLQQVGAELARIGDDLISHPDAAAKRLRLVLPASPRGASAGI